MKRKCLFFMLFAFSAVHINAQVIIKGEITDAATGKPLPAVSIYVNNSATGTVSNERGGYTLEKVYAQRFDLVISCIGYETVSKPLSAANIPPHLNFKLVPRSTALQSIIVQADDKNGWSKWGQLFIDNFLGTGDGADKCKIVNKKAVKFRFDKAEEKLSIYANEPLIIENKYLGYSLTYDLQFFKYDFKANSIFFLGYPLFKSMQGSAKDSARWMQNRRYAYEGSMLHFMRALYNNNLEEEKFVVNTVKRIPNTDKTVPLKNMRGADGSVMVALPDSTDYTGRTLLLLDSIDQVGNKPVVRDSLAYRVDSATIVFKFKGHMQVSYGKEKAMGVQDKFHADFIKGKPSSIITLMADKIYVYKNGTYYEPDNIFIEGYWSRIEKLHNLLPINYGE